LTAIACLDDNRPRAMTRSRPPDPVDAVRYPVAKPCLGDRERELLLDAFDSGWISWRGPYVREVTRAFPRAVGLSSGVPCSSGTAALHLSLLALAAGPGDEVIVPNLTYVATANAPVYVGASPVLADVREDDWSLDPAEVAALVTPRTKGIIAVHLFGVVADLGPLRAFCDRRGLWLIEDCAEAVGATGGSRRPGMWGELSTWSFFANKVLTSGEGGFVTTAARDDLVRAAEEYANQAVDPAQHHLHRQLGYNYRITNLQCALLCAQIESLERFCTARAAIHAVYEDALRPAFERGLLLRTPRPEVCWLYCAVLNPQRLGDARDAVAARLLARHGIDTRPFPHAMHTLPHLAHVRAGRLEVSARLARTGLNLPTYVSLEPADVRLIAATLIDCLEEAAG
jgi:perosamine synthetase